MRHDLVLEGENVRLEPLAPKHLEAVRAIAGDPELWQYTYQFHPFASDDAALQWLTSALDAPGVQAFVIIDKRSGDLAGSTRYLDIDERNRKLEIGWTFYARRFWRTHVNTEAKFLLLRYAFETWGALRVQFKAEAVNTRSHEAILRLGATHEGTLRNYRIRANGEERDTNVYSVVESEWGMVKERLLSFLDRNRDSLSTV